MQKQELEAAVMRVYQRKQKKKDQFILDSVDLNKRFVLGIKEDEEELQSYKKQLQEIKEEENATPTKHSK